MSIDPTASEATVAGAWEQSLPADLEPEKTISANLQETRRMTRTSLGEGLRRLGYAIGAELGRGGPGSRDPR